jgi:hypothetical protein
MYTKARREGGAGSGEPAELGVAMREATSVAGAAAALPQRAQLRLVRRTTARRTQHSAHRAINQWIPELAAGEFKIARARRGVGFGRGEEKRRPREKTGRPSRQR